MDKLLTWPKGEKLYQLLPHGISANFKFLVQFYLLQTLQIGVTETDWLLRKIIPLLYERSHGVMVSTLDFESSDPSSSLGGTFFSFYSSFSFVLLCREQLH